MAGARGVRRFLLDGHHPGALPHHPAGGGNSDSFVFVVFFC